MADAAGGVLRAHTVAALGAATALSLGRTRSALRVFAEAGLLETVRGPGQRRRVRLRAEPPLDAWLAPFFAEEARLCGAEVGPHLPGACLVRLADAADVPAIKRLVDRHRREMGFVLRATLEAGQQRGGLWIAHAVDHGEPLTALGNEQAQPKAETQAGTVASALPAALGYVQVHHRRDGQVTLHTIAVDAAHRDDGLGRALVAAVERDCRRRGMRGILLRCPHDLPANRFYARLGFTHLRTEPGKHRPLLVWWKDA